MIGKHLGKVKDYTISLTKAGKKQVAVQFTYEVDGQAHETTWYGQLELDNSGDNKGKTITLKALAAMGMTQDGARRFSSDFFKGIESGILDVTKDLMLDLQEDVNDQGKTTTKIAWVNDPNDVYILKKLTAAENIQAMQGMSIENDFFNVIQAKGAKGAGPGAAVPPMNNNQFMNNNVQNMPMNNQAPQQQNYQQPMGNQMPMNNQQYQQPMGQQPQTQNFQQPMNQAQGAPTNGFKPPF